MPIDINGWPNDIDRRLGEWESGRMFMDEFPRAVIERDCRKPSVDGRVPQSTERAIFKLLEASNYAEDAGRNVWEFAVTIGELRRDGVSENDLRWLICRGFIE